LTTHDNDPLPSGPPRGNSDLTSRPCELREARRTRLAAAVIQPPATTRPLPSIDIPRALARSGAPRRRRAAARAERWRRAAAGPWPLLGVLAAQALLSLRLFPANTTFRDEALYLWTGQLEWSGWLHGAQVPGYFPTFLSGSPVVYPPLAALANSAGGLEAARGLSLCFMLGATALLYCVTIRIFDRRAALFAAALFAGAGSVQFLGGFATYDAMALFLLALATWLGVRAADAGPVAQCLLEISAGAALAVSNAAKYAATLFDPVVIVVIALLVWQRRGCGRGIAAALTAATTVVTLIGWALRVAGTGYWQGIEDTTLARQHGDVPVPGILFASGKWVGVVAALAVIGAASMTVTGRWPQKALAWSLAAAVFLAPAEQARIHVITSLFKHVAYGAWFGCIVAGYGLGALALAVPAAKVRAALAVGAATVVVAAVPGVFLASFHFASWPRATAMTTAIRADLSSVRGPKLLEDSYIIEYYLGGRLGWQNLTSNYYFTYTDPLTGTYIAQPRAAYADAIRHRYFGLIELCYSPHASDGYDAVITSAIARYGGYRLVTDVPFRASADDGRFLVWVRQQARVRPR
jgi:4-amino-4-deoxy-L-arabinose transferase-like glycosyltransferase